MAIYRFDLAEVDTARRSLRVNGVTRDIGSRAFDLLVTLIEARDRVLNKDWLLEHVWPDVVVEEGNLYVQISTLRRVIGAKSIATVPGRGYQFTGELLSSAPPVVASAIPAPSAGIPSIAVLPFKAPGISEDRAHLVEGIVEAIVTGLSQMPRLNVIGSASSLSYKGREVDVRAVGRELAVRYVLGGSVRVGSDRLRLNAQLVESEGAKTLWAEQLDGAPQDLLDFSDDLTTRVVMAIVPSVDAAEFDRVYAARPENLAAYDLYLRALVRVREMTRESSAAAIELLHAALEKHPGFAAAAGLAAWAYALRIPQGWSDDQELDSQRGLALASMAIEDHVVDPEALSRGGYATAFLSRDAQRGLPAVERAIRIGPNHAGLRIDAGWVNLYCGRHEQAKSDFHHFIRLSPRDPMLYRAHAGLAFGTLLTGDFEAAANWAKRALAGNMRFTPAHRALVAALGYVGEPAQSARAVADLIGIVPGLTIERFERETRFQAGCGLEVLLEGMRRAGMPR